jgi:putative transposase
MTRFRDKYRVEAARLPDWDNASVGWYFVTVCTKDGVCHFGEAVDDDMQLSPIGEIVAEEWQQTGQVRLNVKLDEWVVMPNHVHGIIVIIVSQLAGGTVYPVMAGRSRGMVETSRRDVSTGGRARLQAGSLGAIIGQVKSKCTKRIWTAGYTDFAWQPRFYDHIIRDEASLARIRQYIATNPARWAVDEYYARHG